MIYLIGGAGNGNFGDELIVKGWLHYLSEKGLEQRTVLDGNNAEISSEFFGRDWPAVAFRDDIHRIALRGEKNSFFESIRRGLYFFENGGFSAHQDMGHLNDLFEKMNIFHLHGGGYINTIWPENAFILGLAAAMKRRFKCKVVGTGLGILPAAEPPEQYQEMLSEVVEAFDLIEVRDRWSYEYLRRVSDARSIVLGLDDSYIIRLPQSPQTASRTLHVSYFPSAGNFEKVLEFVGGGRASEFAGITFWACTRADLDCFERLKQVAPSTELRVWRDLMGGPLPVVLGDFMITARFHPHLLAARLGADGVFWEDRGYYDVKHGSVVDLGSPFAVMQGEIDTTRPSPKAFRAIHEFDEMRVSMKRILADYIYA